MKEIAASRVSPLCLVPDRLRVLFAIKTLVYNADEVSIMWNRLFVVAFLGFSWLYCLLRFVKTLEKRCLISC